MFKKILVCLSLGFVTLVFSPSVANAQVTLDGASGNPYTVPYPNELYPNSADTPAPYVPLFYYSPRPYIPVFSTPAPQGYVPTYGGTGSAGTTPSYNPATPGASPAAVAPLTTLYPAPVFSTTGYGGSVAVSSPPPSISPSVAPPVPGSSPQELPATGPSPFAFLLLGLIPLGIILSRFNPSPKESLDSFSIWRERVSKKEFPS